MQEKTRQGLRSAGKLLFVFVPVAVVVIYLEYRLTLLMRAHGWWLIQHAPAVLAAGLMWWFFSRLFEPETRRREAARKPKRMGA
ncbi:MULTISPECIES: hypothetical protein [Dyella]|uniref:Uncharacterized protein n=2 Tax=Dyella TaxID=231454 RepID=A0A4R0YIZ9_9GAMM|nr:MULTISPECIES: hypothetical protein [Dyella]TBR36476.1 hypothetical protein EYV96_11055 [Dyella terrae]TCI08432.1 hypothetical protein EZM97_27815 [Dyella soli]